MINYFFNSEAISKLATSVFDFIGKPAPEEYSRAVKDLHDPEVMHRILEERIKDIENDPKLSRSEKEALKNAVLSQYQASDTEHMQACADIVDRDTKNKSEVATKIIWGIVAGAAALGAAYGVANGIQSCTGQLQIVPRSTR